MPLSPIHDAAESLALLARWGPLEAPPEPVAGGLQHRVYRLRTGGGDFAVKAISPSVAAYDGIRERLRRAERIASAVAASGLPAVAALELAGETVHDLKGALLLAYPWVEGRALPSSSSAGAEVGGIVGDLVGRVHALDLPSECGPAPTGDEVASDPWEPLVAEAEAQGAAWSAEARAALPDLCVWAELAREARRGLGDRRVVGHGDLDPKNVLWSEDGSPWMVDWESAGPVPPAKEIVTAALDWSGHGQDLATFRSVLVAYRTRAELSASDARLGLRAYFDWLGWLEHSMRRSLSSDAEERAIGARETESTLAALRGYAVNLHALDRSCG